MLQLRQKGKNLFLRQIERSRHCNAADTNILPMQIDLRCALLRHTANIRLGTLDLALGIPILLHRGMCTHTAKADTACQKYSGDSLRLILLVHHTTSPPCCYPEIIHKAIF